MDLTQLESAINSLKEAINKPTYTQGSTIHTHDLWEKYKSTFSLEAQTALSYQVKSMFFRFRYTEDGERTAPDGRHYTVQPLNIDVDALLEKALCGQNPHEEIGTSFMQAFTTRLPKREDGTYDIDKAVAYIRKDIDAVAAEHQITSALSSLSSIEINVPVDGTTQATLSSPFEFTKQLCVFSFVHVFDPKYVLEKYKDAAVLEGCVGSVLE